MNYEKCLYCGRLMSTATLKYHQSLCEKNPSNNFTEEPQRYDPSKKFLQYQKIIVGCCLCKKDVIVKFAALKKQKLILCRSCSVKQRYDDPNYKKAVKEKREAALIEKYGSLEAADSARKEKMKATCLKKYGVVNGGASKQALEKIAKTKKERYGDPFYTNREKCWKTIESRYGVSHNFAMKSVIENRKQTYLKHYGVDNPSKAEEVKDKKYETNLKRYGSWYTATQSYYARAKQTRLEHFGKWNPDGSFSYIYEYDNVHFNSKPELAFWIYCEDHGVKVSRDTVRFTYDFGGKQHEYIPDFRLNESQFIELKGSQFVKEDGTWQNPFDHTQDALYEAKHQCALRNNVRILYSADYQKYLDYVNEKYTNDFLELFRTDALFPYLNSDFRDKSDLGLIRHFHKSVYEASRKGCLSPQQAWRDKSIVKKVALNRLQYVKACDPETVLKGFSVTRIAPKVSVFRPKMAEDLIKKYLNEHNVIVDPFSGFSGRLLGAYSCKKAYVGKDINEDHVKESNEIIQFKNMQNISVTVEDLLKKQDIEEYDCLFTCPPYGGKEHWNENNDEVEKSCDEWIELCLQHYKCKKYLFVIDETEKYKDFVVENINAKNGMFATKGEEVVLIESSCNS